MSFCCPLFFFGAVGPVGFQWFQLGGEFFSHPTWDIFLFWEKGYPPNFQGRTVELSELRRHNSLIRLVMVSA